MESNTFIICQLFQAKPALFYQDGGVTKIGSFISYDFNIAFGKAGTDNAGEVRTPRNLQISAPLKVGDIVEVTVVNQSQLSNLYHHYTSESNFRASVNLDGTGFSNQNSLFYPIYQQHRGPLRKCFSVSTIDGDRLVLRDFVEYNLSYVPVGFVGGVHQQNLLDVLRILSNPELRAYAGPMFRYQHATGPVDLAFLVDQSLINEKTSFSDNYQTNNVKPWDIIKAALKPFDAVVSSMMYEKDGLFYPIQFITRGPQTKRNLTLRVKPGVTVNLMPLVSSKIATVWIQPDENADQYIRAGVVVKHKGKLYKREDVPDYNPLADPITEMGHIEVPFSTITEREVDTDREIDQAEDNTVRDTRCDNKYKKALEAPLSSENSRALLDDTLRGGKTIKATDPDNVYPDIKEKLNNAIGDALSDNADPLSIELSYEDFYQTNLDLYFSDDIKLYYINIFGGGMQGSSVELVNVNISPSGLRLRFEGV